MNKRKKYILKIVSKRVKIRLTRLDEELLEAGFLKGEIVYAARHYVNGKKATRLVMFDSKAGEFSHEAYIGVNCELAS